MTRELSLSTSCPTVVASHPSDRRIVQFLRLCGRVWPYFPVSVLGIPRSLNTAFSFILVNKILLISTLWPLTLTYRLFWNASLHVCIFYRSRWYLLLFILWKLQEKVSSFEGVGGTWRPFLWPRISSASISQRDTGYAPDKSPAHQRSNIQRQIAIHIHPNRSTWGYKSS